MLEEEWAIVGDEEDGNRHSYNMPGKMNNRREFLQKAGCECLLLMTWGCHGLLDCESVYPGWLPGEMDIHFIHTGVGEQTFFIFPDGTNMLLDCGHMQTRRAGYAEAVPARPSSRLRGGEWVSRYIQRLIHSREIDWCVVSHWHDDHVLGLNDVARDFRIRRWMDHQYPHIGMYESDASRDSLRFAREFIPSEKAKGMLVLSPVVGAANQIDLIHGGVDGTRFEIRTIAANGVVWDGKDGAEDCASIHIRESGGNRVGENQLSLALRIQYGKFRYFTGGDVEQSMIGLDGRAFDWEERVGAVCGSVNVCKSNHHSFWNAMRSGFVRAVRARAFLSSVWSPNQVNDRSLGIMSSRDLYPEDRIVYYGFLPYGKEYFADDPRWRNTISSVSGHHVVKVAKGGDSFKIFTLTAADESMRILACQEYAT